MTPDLAALEARTVDGIDPRKLAAAVDARSREPRVSFYHTPDFPYKLTIIRVKICIQGTEFGWAARVRKNASAKNIAKGQFNLLLDGLQELKGKGAF